MHKITLILVLLVPFLLVGILVAIAILWIGSQTARRK